ncbi:MAG: hypothetical protein CL908_25830 [Deltaproteobacteria bacterium]|nr:hypothetical protein [Deltaproteobacteria bacterium]
MSCLDSVDLQSLIDGTHDAAARAEADRHLRACGECRDALRAFQRVEGFLRRVQAVSPSEDLLNDVVVKAMAGLTAVPREPAAGASLEVAAEVRESGDQWDKTAEAAPRASTRRGWFLVPLSAAAAAVVCVAVFGGAEAGTTREKAVSRPLLDLARTLREIAPDARRPGEASWFLGEIVARRPEWDDGDRLTPAGRSELLRGLRGMWHRADAPDDHVRLLRVAAALDASEFRHRAERLVLDVPEPLLEAAITTLAAFGGDEAAKALVRVSLRRELPTGVLAEALVRTKSRRVARRVWNLLTVDGEELERSYVLMHRVPGRAASRILVGDFLAGSEAPVLRRVIAERTDALAILRSELSRVDLADRVRVLGLLGEAGDRKAVPLLERQLKGVAFDPALKALARVAHAGSSDAMLAVARALGPLEDVGDWPTGARDQAITRVLRGLPESAAPLFLDAYVERPGRVSDRRRYLIAAGIVGGDLVRDRVERALPVAQVRRAALTALGLLGRRGAVASVRRHATSEDRGTRRCALAALARLGGDESARVLTRALRRSADRRTVIAFIRYATDPWVIPVYIDGLRYRDTHDDCLRGLRRLVGGRGPEGGDPDAWKVWFGLEVPPTAGPPVPKRT